MKALLLVAAMILLAGRVMAQQEEPAFSCPDDGAVDILDNTQGTTDKIVSCNYPLSSSGKDVTFQIQVYDPANGKTVSSVFYDGENEPSITCPPGKKVRVQDRNDENTSNHDDGSKGPQGTVHIAPG